METSIGHFGFYGQFEYIAVGSDIYRAPVNNALGVDGRRMGLRFEFPRWMVNEFCDKHGAYDYDFLAYWHGDYKPTNV